MGKRVLKNFRQRVGGEVSWGVPDDVMCGVSSTFLPNFIDLFQVGEMVSVVAMLAAYCTRLIRLEPLFFGCLCVMIACSLGGVCGGNWFWFNQF